MSHESSDVVTQWRRHCDVMTKSYQRGDVIVTSCWRHPTSQWQTVMLWHSGDVTVMSFEDPILIFLLVSLFWTLQLDWVKPITISVSDTVIKSRNSWYIQQKIYTTLLKLLLRKPRWEYASSACIFHTAVLTCGVGRFTLVSCSCLVYTIYSFGKVARWVHLSSQGVHGIYKFIMRAKGMVYGGITSIHPHTSRVNACDNSLNER